MMWPQRLRSEHGDAIELLRAQHAELEGLLEIIARNPAATPRDVLLPELAELCAVHRAIEERIFYPGVGLTPSDDDLDRAVAELTAAARIDAPLAELARRARACLRDHEDVQERRVFPPARRNLDAVRLRRLAYEMRVLEFELRTNMNLRSGDSRTAASDSALA